MLIRPKKEKRKIEYLFPFVVNGKDDLHWCAGYIIDVSDGEDFSKWRMGTTGRSNKCYKRGEAVKVLWDAVGAHPSEETTVPFRPIGRKVLGGCISNNK